MKEGCEIMPINENTLEQVIISELQEKGYEYLYGPEIDRDYHEVILKDYFESAMFKINPGITVEIVEKLINYKKPWPA